MTYDLSYLKKIKYLFWLTYSKDSKHLEEIMVGSKSDLKEDVILKKEGNAILNAKF